MKVKALKNFVKDGILYREGEEFSLPDADAEYCIGRGLVERFVGPLPKKPPNVPIEDTIIGSAEIDPPIEGVETTLPPLAPRKKK